MIPWRILLDCVEEHRSDVVRRRLKKVAEQQKVVLDITKLARAGYELQNRWQAADQLDVVVGFRRRPNPRLPFARRITAFYEIAHPRPELFGEAGCGCFICTLITGARLHQLAKVEFPHACSTHQVRQVVECDRRTVTGSVPLERPS